MSEKCAICGATANQRCSRCHVTSYCSREHQKKDWKNHKGSCRPYITEESPTLGRYVIAARDFAEGEIIMKDTPLVLGPKQITMPVCVSCSSNVDGSCVCPRCGWPLCNPECANVSLHIPECQVSIYRRDKVEITKFFQINEMYECITPLRCLWLKKTCPKKWETLMKMESHIEGRKRNKSIDLDKSNVIDFIRGYLKYTEFEDEDIYNICGILEVNGFEIPAPNIIGLYGEASLLEHSCVANAARTFDSEMNVLIRATVPIKKGEHISTSYTDPMWGTANRQMHLSSTKYFECKCSRCRDPTELGTYLSSLKCPNCLDILSPPLERNEHWKCRKCRTATPVHIIDKVLKQWGEKLTTLRGNLSDSEDFLKDSQVALPENHFYRVDVKVALANLIGKQNKGQLTGLSEEQLQKKVKYCRDVLELVDAFSPGTTRLRGLMLFELAMSMWELQRRKDKNIRFEKKSLPILKKIQENLKTSHGILILESPLQEEHQMAMQAEEKERMVAKEIKKCKK